MCNVLVKTASLCLEKMCITISKSYVSPLVICLLINGWHPPVKISTPACWRVRISSKCVDVEILFNFGNCFHTSGRILKISFWNYVSSLLSTHFDPFYFYRSRRFGQKIQLCTIVLFDTDLVRTM